MTKLWAFSDNFTATVALEAALVKSGQPAIMNKGHGSKHTVEGCITKLAMANIKIFMDGLSRYLDNIFLNRL